MEAKYSSAVLSSMVASKLNKKLDNGLSGIDLEILELIKLKEKVTNSQIANIEKLPKTEVEEITNYLEEKQLIKHGSPWEITPKGLKVLEEADKIYESIAKIVKHDSFFNSIELASGKN